MAPRAIDAKAAERCASIVGAKQKDDEPPASDAPVTDVALSPFPLTTTRRRQVLTQADDPFASNQTECEHIVDVTRRRQACPSGTPAGEVSCRSADWHADVE
jgi:hypothetical protein